jgi:hypothetical protein
MHWTSRVPRHRRLPHYLRAMLIDAERDDEAVLRAEDEAIRAQDVIETPPEPLANLLEILNDGRAADPLPQALDGRETEGRRPR